MEKFVTNAQVFLLYFVYMVTQISKNESGYFFKKMNSFLFMLFIKNTFLEAILLIFANNSCLFDVFYALYNKNAKMFFTKSSLF